MTKEIVKDLKNRIKKNKLYILQEKEKNLHSYRNDVWDDLIKKYEIELELLIQLKISYEKWYKLLKYKNNELNGN